MSLSELPMILFTVFTQMAVGAFIMLGLIQTFASVKYGRETVKEITTPLVYAIGPVMVAGLGVSMLHMHDIMNTLNVLRHFGGSWLSNEVVLGSAFAGFGFLFAAMQWFKKGGTRLGQIVAAVTAVIGIIFVFSMSMVYYTVVTVPAWNNLATPVGFFSTALVMGATSMSAALMTWLAYRCKKGNPASPEARAVVGSALKVFAVITATIAAITVVRLPLYLQSLSAQGEIGAASANAVSPALLGARVAFLIIGVILMTVFIFYFRLRTKEEDRNDKLLLIVTWTSFALVLLAELMGRAMFYEAMIRVGM